MQQRSVKFRYDSGVRAKDYSSVAKKDNLKPIEVELKRLEETTMQIHEELQQARDSEVKMRLARALLPFPARSVVSHIGYPLAAGPSTSRHRLACCTFLSSRSPCSSC
jgi:hypothetical protein